MQLTLCNIIVLIDKLCKFTSGAGYLLLINHVHIGTGKIGLGLVGEFSFDLNLPTTFINRDNGQLYQSILKENKQYYLNTEGDSKRIGPVTFHTYLEDNLDAPESQSALSSISLAELITVSIGSNNLNNIVPVLLKGIEKRLSIDETKNIPILLMAFENLQSNSEVLKKLILKSAKSSQIKNFIESNLISCNTLIDRICTDIKENTPAVGEFCCPVEKYNEIIINKSSDDLSFKAVFDILKNHDSIKLVSNDEFELYEKRKYWLVNGIHLAIAVYALSKNILLINQAIMDDNIRGDIKAVQGDFSIALEALSKQKRISAGFTKDELDEFNLNVIKRFGKKQDEVTRILYDLFVYYTFPNKLDSFVASLKEENRTRIKTRNINYHDEFKPWMSQKLNTFFKEFDLGKFINKINKRICEPLEILFTDSHEVNPRQGHLLLFRTMVVIETFLKQQHILEEI